VGLGPGDEEHLDQGWAGEQQVSGPGGGPGETGHPDQKTQQIRGLVRVDRVDRVFLRNRG
jgi:hypothetical protein